MRPFIAWFLILFGFAIPPAAPVLWVWAAWIIYKMGRDYHLGRSSAAWMADEQRIQNSARGFDVR